MEFLIVDIWRIGAESARDASSWSWAVNSFTNVTLFFANRSGTASL